MLVTTRDLSARLLMCGQGTAFVDRWFQFNKEANPKPRHHLATRDTHVSLLSLANLKLAWTVSKWRQLTATVVYVNI